MLLFLWRRKIIVGTFLISYILNVLNNNGAKLYARPSTLVSSGAKVPVAPVESAPLIFTYIANR